MTSSERFSLTASDGFPVSVFRWSPAGQARAALQIVHGMAEHAARYSPFAERCAAAGIAVYAHDQRGHGSSIHGEATRGHFADDAGWSKVLGDVRAVQQRLRDERPGVPVFILGHSMGSFVTRAHLLEHDVGVSGAILSATGWRAGLLNALLGWVAAREARTLGARAPSARMRSLVFGTFNLRLRPARTAFDWLSRDPAVVDAYMADPLCGFDCSGQLWADLFAAIRDIERAEASPTRLARTLPLFLMAGTHDPVSMGGLGHGQLAARYRAAGNTDVDDRRYPEARHELVNETNREEVWRDVIGWIDARVSSSLRA